MIRGFLALALASLAAGSPAGEGNRQGQSPLIGTWEWKMPNGCVERHTFLATGRMLGRSVAEQVEEQFEVSAQPDGKGFFKLSGKTLKDSGGPDCSGSTEDHTGKTWAVYVRFTPGQQEHMVCVEPDMKTCWGPYRRVAP